MISITDIMKSVSSVNLTHYSSTLLFARAFLILCLFLAWPFVIDKVAKRYCFSIQNIVFWKSQRNRVIAWLVIFDLVICENIFSSLIRML